MQVGTVQRGGDLDAGHELEGGAGRLSRALDPLDGIVVGDGQGGQRVLERVGDDGLGGEQAVAEEGVRVEIDPATAPGGGRLVHQTDSSVLRRTRIFWATSG